MSNPVITSGAKRLQALYQMSIELTALQPLDAVLDMALAHCLTLTDSEFGFVGLITETGDSLDVVTVQGFKAEDAFYERHHLIPLRPNIFARVVLENRSVRSVDARYDPHRVGQPEGHPPVLTFLGVPLRHRDKPIGMIGVANRPDPYAEDDEHLLMTYAAQISIVISNAQLYEQLTATKATLEQKVDERTRELQVAQSALMQKAEKLRSLYTETITIQETERQRIARDMHDGINQLLIGAMLELKSARARLVSGDVDVADESLSNVQTVLREVEAEIQRVVYDLRPPILDELGFVPALKSYMQDFRKYTGLSSFLTIEGVVVRLPEKSEVSIYRMLQEALQNVYQHASASNVDVIIRFADDALHLVVEDDGCGFAVDRVEDLHKHFGLTTMQERANSLGGTLTITSSQGEGTQITMCVPMV